MYVKTVSQEVSTWWGVLHVQRSLESLGSQWSTQTEHSAWECIMVRSIRSVRSIVSICILGFKHHPYLLPGGCHCPLDCCLPSLGMLSRERCDKNVVSSRSFRFLRFLASGVVCAGHYQLWSNSTISFSLWLPNGGRQPGSHGRDQQRFQDHPEGTCRSPGARSDGMIRWLIERKKDEQILTKMWFWLILSFESFLLYCIFFFSFVI